MTDIVTTTFLPVSFKIPPSPLRVIAEEVAAKHGLTVSDLKSPTQAYKIAHARQEAMWRMREETSHSTTKIGQFFGRHHTTVIFAVRAHERRMAR